MPARKSYFRDPLSRLYLQKGLDHFPDESMGSCRRYSGHQQTRLFHESYHLSSQVTLHCWLRYLAFRMTCLAKQQYCPGIRSYHLVIKSFTALIRLTACSFTVPRHYRRTIPFLVLGGLKAPPHVTTFTSVKIWNKRRYRKLSCHMNDL